MSFLIQDVAGRTSGEPSPRPNLYLLVIGILCLFFLLIGIYLTVRLLWKGRKVDSTSQNSPNQITKRRLLSVWQQFLEPLAPSVRAALTTYEQFVVFGDPGVGKSALITRRVDWQTQASQFLPSHTTDPFIQIYLGSRSVVQEISSTLLASTSREAHDALRKFWKASLSSGPVPTVTIVLKVSLLTTVGPDVLRQQAKLIRGKLNLLAEQFGTSIHTRICLTNMERIAGYSEFARFLFKHKLPLVLDATGDAQSSLGAALQGYEKHLPRALTTMSVGPFEASVEILHSAEELMTPVRAFIAALIEGAQTTIRPAVQSVYFFSLSADEEVGNPFETSVSKASKTPPWFAGLSRWFVSLGIQPLHALLCLLILSLGIGPFIYLTRLHTQKIQRASNAVFVFSQSVRRAQETLTSPLESEVVRRNEREAAASLAEVQKEEQRFRFLRWFAQREKAEAQDQFVDGIRKGYLRPALESGVRQRQRDKILYGLAALYASKGSALGTLVSTQQTDFSQTLSVPSDLLTDYVDNSPQPWQDKALLILPPIPSDSAHYPVTDVRPWAEFVETISRAISQPFISTEQLEKLRKKADSLRETIERVHRATLMRKIYQMLAETTPMDMNKLFGGDVGTLTPDPWIVDNMEQMERLLRLVRDGSARFAKHGHMSLLQLLRWINSLSVSERALSWTDKDKPLFAQDPTHFAFPSGKIHEISERGWFELLLRSRKHWLLSHQIKHVHGTSSRRHTACCGCVSERRRKRGRCVPCGELAPHTSHSHRACRHQERRFVPPFSPEELRPRVASLVSRGELVPSDLGEEYSRVMFDTEVLPLVRELRKAVSESKALNPEDRIRLSHLVRREIESYSRRYCKGLERFYLSYHFHVNGHSVESYHTALLHIVRPGSRFISHLQTVAHNASLSGLEDPYLRPLADCLLEFRPIVQAVQPDLLKRAADKSTDDKDHPKPNSQIATKAALGVPKQNAQNEATPEPKTPSNTKTNDTDHANSDENSKDLEPYLSAVAKQAEELDTLTNTTETKSSKATNPLENKITLADSLGTLGKSALGMALGGKAESPRHSAEQFLDKAGIVGSFRRPFMEPFDAVYRQGEKEIETALAKRWKEDTQPLLNHLISRFPFNQAAEREVSPAEMEVLNEANGAFFAELRNYYETALVLQGGTYLQRRHGLGSFQLPKDLLPTANRVARLSRMLFDEKGGRKPLRITFRGVAGRPMYEKGGPHPVLSFLRVGKTTIYGFNQRTIAEALNLEWWNQGVAMVGIDTTLARSGRRHSQTLEVADSAWSLLRLLQKSTLEPTGESVWRIHDDSAGDARVIRFVVEPDPWMLFRITPP